MYFDIFKGNVFQSDSRLSLACTFLIKWVQHTSRSISIRLPHLLRSNVNGPPNWSVHCKVFVINICNVSVSLITRICFNINTFQGSFLNYISKCNISNTTTTNVRRNATYSKTDSKNNLNILDKHVPCAIYVLTGFWYYNVIPILDC